MNATYNQLDDLITAFLSHWEQGLQEFCRGHFTDNLRNSSLKISEISQNAENDLVSEADTPDRIFLKLMLSISPNIKGIYWKEYHAQNFEVLGNSLLKGILKTHPDDNKIKEGMEFLKSGALEIYAEHLGNNSLLEALIALREFSQKNNFSEDLLITRMAYLLTPKHSFRIGSTIFESISKFQETLNNALKNGWQEKYVSYLKNNSSDLDRLELVFSGNEKKEWQKLLQEYKNKVFYGGYDLLFKLNTSKNNESATPENSTPLSLTEVSLGDNIVFGKHPTLNTPAIWHVIDKDSENITLISRDELLEAPFTDNKGTNIQNRLTKEVLIKMFTGNELEKIRDADTAINSIAKTFTFLGILATKALILVSLLYVLVSLLMPVAFVTLIIHWLTHPDTSIMSYSMIAGGIFIFWLILKIFPGRISFVNTILNFGSLLDIQQECDPTEHPPLALPNSVQQKVAVNRGIGLNSEWWLESKNSKAPLYSDTLGKIKNDTENQGKKVLGVRAVIRLKNRI